MIAYDNGHAEAEDETVLHAPLRWGGCCLPKTKPSRDCKPMAARCRQFAGVVFASQGSLTTGETIEWLELIAKASTPQELFNSVQFIPLR